MKTCKGCGALKSLEGFYRHSKMADGHLNYCKECKRSEMRSRHIANPGKRRAYDRRRFQEDPRVRERHKRYQKTEAGKLAMRKSKLKWQEANSEKRAAHIILGNAVARGEIVKPSACEKCGERGNIHGHHDDYTRPLDVVWVCPKCHANIHERKRKNG